MSISDGRDDYMASPGAHEDDAVEALHEGRTEEAQVHAILALASAVNRLADAYRASPH